ncbi:xylulokinase [Vibrio sp. CAIM 722]|uniref:Xylulose kinase n=1 Tax=Vibrio eleionomae TaxID=2653505 RepID=A0A7X4LN75_9VIBR|nr:xylulokinase [Vibrio eleionomae]MZI95072.1 xylulokinase [Vibrio eleionomae]
MYIGIDLGTSGVKSILMTEEGEVVQSATVSMSVSRPQPLWSEQDPNQWWKATCQSIQELGQKHSLTNVKAIGLSGQMHGVTLLDSHNNILRPAILWNDGRCAKECQWLEEAVPDSREITGNLMMPGFSAPKIKWVQNNEPEVFTKIAKVLLPKDYLRFRLTGQYASDMSDAAGTMWLDIDQRDWSDKLLAATGLNRSNMPKLYEGSEVTGTLLPNVAEELGLSKIPVIAGGGDNAAGAIGVGTIEPGQAMISLGTSGVYFAVSHGVVTNPEAALHSFCHALPNTWHTMSVILSAASCLNWVANLTNFNDVPSMMEELEQRKPTTDIVFLPYLSGERTPHNNPDAKGVFFGMTHTTDRYQLAQSVLEGVGFALADGLDAMHTKGKHPNEISLIGGGARSPYWRQMLANIFNQTLVYRQGGDVGPALGAARLAQLALATPGTNTRDICPQPPVLAEHHPDLEQHQGYAAKRQLYKALYDQLKSLF